MSDSRPSLRNYADNGSEEAFADLVRCHLQMVYATAARRVGGDPELARDIVQTVFADLAFKARRLPPDTLLAGWLYRHTTFVAAGVLRRECRRRQREQEAALMNSLSDDAPLPRWEDALPLLDDALACLRETDRSAIVLRFFQGHDLRSVGLALGSSEDAAQKRIARALERLRSFFAKRGVSLSAGAIAAGLAGQGATAVPLAASAVAGAALASVPVAAGVAASFGITNLLFMAKMKMIGAAVVIAGGLAVPLVLQQKSISQLRAENDALRSAVAVSMAAPAGAVRPADTRADPGIELARLRSEVTQLRGRTQELARSRPPVPALATAANPPPARRPAMRDYIPSDTWIDAGLATPEAALQTIGWAIRHGDIPKFKQTVHFTEAAHQVLTDMLARMPPQAVAEVRAKGWGFEEALLFPAMAQDKRDTYKAFRIVSQESPSDDELVVQAEIETAAGRTHKRPMRFRRIGDEWKQFYDASDVQAMK